MSQDTLQAIIADPDPQFTFAFGDSAVCTIKRSGLVERELSNLLTRDDGNVIDYRMFESPKSPFEAPQTNHVDSSKAFPAKGNVPGAIQEGLPIEIPFEKGIQEGIQEGLPIPFQRKK